MYKSVLRVIIWPGAGTSCWAWRPGHHPEGLYAFRRKCSCPAVHEYL